MRGVGVVVALALGVLLAGCSVQESGPPLPGSLEELVERVAEVRGLDAPDALDVRYVPRSGIPALLDELLTDDDQAIMDEVTTLYRLLGYIENDQTYLEVYRSFGQGSILGLYSPDRDTLWVVHADDEPATFENLSRGQVATLAHEVIHALQDYHFELDEVYAEVGHDMDRGLAWTAVVEGDAVTHEGVFSDKYLAVPVGAGAGRVYMLGAQVNLSQVPDAVVRELYFPYTTGADWVEGLRAEDGTETIDRLIVDPPNGTAFVLHPELLAEGWEPEEVTLADIAGELGDGWEQESGGQFGEFQLSNFLRQELGGEATEAADGWAGDAYGVYRDGEDAVAVFQVVFRDEGEAEEFAGALEKYLGEAAELESTNGGVGIAVMDDGDVVAWQGPDGREVRWVVGTGQTVAVAGFAAAR